ncbi:MAG: hypothetical protein IPI27_18340 [Betaproteobacteria bacterium]|nr:hypothetical protein [Betaproteobacteria bacterium]
MGAVHRKCYYASSDDLGISYSGSASSAKSKKHFLDFTIDLTQHQPIAFLGEVGLGCAAEQEASAAGRSALRHLPDGAKRTAGELKCWAITDDGSTELHYNPPVWHGFDHELPVWSGLRIHGGCVPGLGRRR